MPVHLHKKMKYNIKQITPQKLEAKHTKLNNSLESKLNWMDYIYQNLEYGKPSYSIGEIDTFAYRWTSKGLYGYVFEVKSSDNPLLRTKSNKQLRKAYERFIPILEQGDDVKFSKVFLYYVNPNQIKVRNKVLGVPFERHR